ncbi:alpha/beta hydrolase [Bifidobacterium sp. DSM 109957]|uniref:Alpha/beta hydrolase n=1 Tax=Bifidobacterium oedipodis TaxID=2675322 RepID=A0A7Y0EPP0_9BIFI|nr:alpha/beta hydrolase [Bifidobacterium sp. DSM 109957]
MHCPDNPTASDNRIVPNLTVVLVHGWGSSPRTWEGIVWPEGWRILPYTLPGHGNRRDEGSWTIPSASEDLVGFIRQSVPAGERVLLIGHSMGGQLTAMVQAQHPELVLGEVVIDPAYGGDDSPAAVAQMMSQLEAMRSDPLGTLLQFSARCFNLLRGHSLHTCRNLRATLFGRILPRPIQRHLVIISNRSIWFLARSVCARIRPRLPCGGLGRCWASMAVKLAARWSAKLIRRIWMYRCPCGMAGMAIFFIWKIHSALCSALRIGLRELAR